MTCLINLKSLPHILRWHPEFDLNGLTLPPPGTVPESPDSKSTMSASVMLHSIDSNRAQPPPAPLGLVKHKEISCSVSKSKENILYLDKLTTPILTTWEGISSSQHLADVVLKVQFGQNKLNKVKINKNIICK